MDFLMEAWFRFRRNGGSAGVRSRNILAVNGVFFPYSLLALLPVVVF